MQISNRMRNKTILAVLITASLLYVGTTSADVGASGTVTTDAGAAFISKTFLSGSEDRPDLIAIERLYAPSLALNDFKTLLLDPAVSIHGLPVYLAILRLRL